MQNNSFTTIITTKKTTNDTFMAIKNIPGWWTENVEGKTTKINDEFKVTFGDTYIQLKLIEQLTNYKIVWEVTDGHKHFLKNKKEWVGTKICFEIENVNNEETKISFTHFGLKNALECYDICTDAWNGYLLGSLKKLIETGVGAPDKKE